MTRWKVEFLYPIGPEVGDVVYSPVQNCLKFSTVLGHWLLFVCGKIIIQNVKEIKRMLKVRGVSHRVQQTTIVSNLKGMKDRPTTHLHPSQTAQA